MNYCLTERANKGEREKCREGKRGEGGKVADEGNGDKERERESEKGVRAKRRVY